MIFKINNLVCETFIYKKINERIDSEGRNPHNIFISKEYFNKQDNQYKYNYIVLESVEELEQITQTNNNLYEILQHNKALKPF